MDRNVSRRKQKKSSRRSGPRTVNALAQDIRSRVTEGAEPGTLIRELRVEGSKAAAALELVIWRVHGRIAAAELGDSSTPGLHQLKKQQLLLLETHAGVSPLRHGSLRYALGRADQQPAVRKVAQRITEVPPANRSRADFRQLINAYTRVGGFPPSHQQSSKGDNKSAKQKPSNAKPQMSAGQAEAGISDYRSSVKMSTWRQTLHREHLRRRELPIPSGVRITGKRAGLEVPLAIDHQSPAEPGRIQVVMAKVSENGSQLVIEEPGWPADFFPGIVLEMSWIPARATFVGRTQELDTPLVVRGTAARIDGRYVGHRYDPQVITRETAPGGPGSTIPEGLSETDWVLRALQILGYLDAEGRAVLAEDALERNMVAEIGYPRHQVHRIGPAVVQLISSGLVSRVTGSLDSWGKPVYPPVPGRTPVTLLSFSPFSPVPGRLEPQPKRRKGPTTSREKKAHTVSGFVRRLPDGHNPSDEAVEAHRDAQRHAELANRQPLKPGYTFVRRHRRSG